MNNFEDSLNEGELLAVLNAIPESVLVAKKVNDNGSGDFTLVFCNDEAKRCLPPELLGCHTFKSAEHVLSTEVPWLDCLDKVLNGIPLEPMTYHSGICNAWFRLHMQRAKGTYIVITLENVTEEKSNDEALQKTAFFDMVTGIPNRNKFKVDIQSIIENAQFNGTKLGFLLLDVDNMKNINDYSGHDKGDQVLRSCVTVIKRFSQNIVESYRFGGDEFLVIIKNATSSDTITNTCDAILEEFNKDAIFISGGLSMYPDDSVDRDDILRFSDIALSHSKRHGKNRITVFSVDMHKRFVKKFNMQLRMVKGIINGEFFLVFQPQFDIKEGTLRGFEALVRWRDEGNEEVEPSVFLPIAEESGLINEIGNLVFQKSFEALKLWQKEYSYKGTISINISVAQIMQTDFVATLVSLTRNYEVAPQSIEIEVTEALIATNSRDITTKLNELAGAGFKLSLDNFGAKYSSLNFIQSLPLDTLKIDKSFIDGLAGNNDPRGAVTKAVVDLVQKLGIKTIAEGVEADQQLSVLKEFNCNLYQGFLRAKPMSLEKCNALLAGDKDVLK